MWSRLKKQDQTKTSANLAPSIGPEEKEPAERMLSEAANGNKEEPGIAPGSAKAHSQGASGVWKMGLVVTASAFCGGIAVVLWNRRTLTKMRQVQPIERSDFLEQQGRLWEDDA